MTPGDRVAVIASFTGQAVSITEVVSVDSADGLVSSKVSTADGGVWARGSSWVGVFDRDPSSPEVAPALPHRER
jgi:hypothetical protein